MMKRYAQSVSESCKTSREFSRDKFWIPAPNNKWFPWHLNAIPYLAFFIGFKVRKLEIAFKSALINKNPAVHSQRLNSNDSVKFYETPEIFLTHAWNCRVGKCGVMIAFVIALLEREAANITKHVSLSANQWPCLEYFQESRIHFFKFFPVWLRLLDESMINEK